MPYLPDEDRHQSHERRLAEIERGPYLCDDCNTPYNSPAAAERCCLD